MDHLKHIIREIHRRSLWQVLGIYGVGAWVVMQIVETLTNSLQLPDWFPPLAFILLLVGLPIVMATAFVQEGIGSDAEGGGSTGAGAAPGPERHRPEHGLADPSGQEPDRDQPAGLPGLFTWRNAISGGVLAFALWGVLAAAWLGFGGAASVAPPGPERGEEANPPSIAVLPFADLSPEGDQEYFGDGVAEEILHALARLPGLRVAARTSAFSFKGQDRDIREIGEALGVQALLEGSIRKFGNRVRVTAQLISVEDGFHLWSETYDRELEDLFAVQDEVARAVVEALQVELIGRGDTTLVAAPTESTEAHDEYLRGRFHWNKRTLDGFEAAILHFERAIAADPGYARAYAGLADAYAPLPWYSAEVDATQVFAAARTAAERASALDPELGQPHAALAWVAQYGDFDWETARREFDRAIQKDPSYATAHHWYALMLSFIGEREAAVAEARRAVELDPLSLVINSDLGYVLDHAGEHQAAVRQFRATVELDSDFPLAWFDMTRPLIRLGRFGEAEDALVRWARLRGQDPDEARSLIRAFTDGTAADELATTDLPEVRLGLTSGRMAWFTARAGLAETTLHWLERAYEERSPELLSIKVDPVYDFLRGDPRFSELMQRVGLGR